ncbi:hypothetical protein [Lysinibacillus sp. Bpr_S20]|uniref:hypothetical protein n=1 Tax=Lysinibacillus sp. Bpr_S20 TaxID=2933964 RepID=UPI00201141FE|nr:hypothetical protein [Lysinibacillus sp. Bpr_S20]MCL1701168.1 hypothetical protein [Lysinibacillus sp. Bpr_S20]
MKKELNMQLNIHMDLLQDIAFKSINGITVKEIIELRQIYQQGKYKYFNQLKIRYILHLGYLGLEYEITPELECILFSYINNLIQELPVEGLDNDNVFHLSVN